MADRKLRADHREGNQLRSIDVRLNCLRRADGSVRYAQDQTQVICAVYGPMKCARRDQEFVHRGCLEVVFKPANDRPTPREKEMQKVLHDTFDTAIMSAKHPRTLLRLVVQVVKEDGSLLAACINASYLALLDSGYPMKMSIASVSCCLLPQGHKEGLVSDVKLTSKKVLLLDPTAVEEEKPGACVMCVAFRTDDTSVVSSFTSGVCLPSDFFESVEVLGRASQYVLAVSRKSIQHRYHAELGLQQPTAPPGSTPPGSTPPGSAPADAAAASTSALPTPPGSIS